jgi:CRP-like cAMP-binding protein
MTRYPRMSPPDPTEAPMAVPAEPPAPDARPGAARRHTAALAAPPRILARPFFREGDGMRPIENLLSHRQAEALMDIGALLDYPRGRMIYGQAGEATHLYSIAKGCVRVSRAERDGARQILAFMWPGDLTGLAENGRYVNTAETVQQTRLFGFRTADLLLLMDRDPQLKLQLLLKTAHELRRAQRMMTVLGQHKTDQRLASFLLELAREGHSFDAGRREIMLPMSRFDIADYLGSSPETVARAFASLEEAGVVTRVSPRILRIPDLAALERHIRASHPGRAVTA